ncbi:MAG TPA: diguanylate cyclase [Methylotenera sp.]|nr:diguanylate cyclase [Methylotenera sp.]
MDSNDQETNRLLAVESYEILDSAQETDFDDLVKLAAMIFQVPIATVTIMDDHRQWFKASVGLSVKETSRDISFCTHTLKLNTALVVENTSQDERFADNPLVLGELHLGFYAGVPLWNSDNLAIGTFCIMDQMPRAFTAHELDTLKMLANQAMKLLELRAERNKLSKLINELDFINAALLESEQRWKFALEGAGDGVWDLNINTKKAFFSKKWKDMLGYGGHKLTNNYSTWISLIHKDDLLKFLQALNNCIHKKSDTYAVEYRLLCKDNSWKWVSARGMVVEWNEDNTAQRMVGTHSDITELKKSEEIIWKQANFDALTGLPNRRMFFDHLDSEIKRMSRANAMFALMFFDLDGFKSVNDQYGHHTGDKLLIEVSNRVNQCIRETDVFARLGGDEFIIIVTGFETPTYVEKIADKILQTLNQPFIFEENKMNISASIGISIYPQDGETEDILINHADSAMYAAKSNGKNGWARFNPDWDSESPFG